MLDVTGSATDLGLVIASKTVPTFLLIGYAGVWADRLPRQLVMLASDAVRAGSQGLTAALLLSHQAGLWQLCVLQAVYGGASAFFQPAVGGLVPTIAPPDQLRQANALMSLSWSLTGVAGPAVGGLIVALVNPGFALTVDAATFVVSAGSLAVMRIERQPPAHVRASIWAEFREGLAEVRRRSWVWTMFIYFGLFQLTVLPAIFVLGPYVAKNSLGGAKAWAVILTSSAIGSLLGSTVALHRGAHRPLWVSRRLMVLNSVPVLLLAFKAPTIAIATAMLVSWACIGWSETLWQTLLQHHIPQHALSRVTSLDWTCSLALNPIGFALIGPLAAAAGLHTTLVSIAIVAAVLPLATLAVPSVRNVNLDGESVAATGQPDPVPALD